MADHPAEEQGCRWLRWADEDLLAARHSAADVDIAPRVACGLAQQAAEKAMKALLAAADVDPPKSHNLLRLARMLPPEWATDLLEMDLEDLTHWATEGRYPGDLDEGTSGDAQRAIDLAERVAASAHRALAKDGTSGRP